MPSTPTTKSQVQAYRFVLRRMQSALVRKDAVMLHDPMSTHSRATIVGVVLSAVALLGFMVFGMFKKAPAAPESGVVIGEQSGSIYLVTENPRTLVPTFNLASARLLAMSRGGGDGGGAGEPQVVPDSQLEDIPRSQLHGIPNGPDLLPTQDQLISNNWAVCDEVKLDTSLNEQEQLKEAQLETTVYGGQGNLGREMGNDQAILASAPDGKYYLIYRANSTRSDEKTNAVRAEVDLNDSDLTDALNLSADEVRPMSMGLLNAIPSIGKLSIPDIPGYGSSTSFNVGGYTVGSVFYSQPTDTREYYVVTEKGIQPITPAVARMIRFKYGGDGTIGSVNPAELDKAPTLSEGQDGYLQVKGYPDVEPNIVSASQGTVGCLGWSVEGEGNQRDARTKVYLNSALPGPKNAKGQPQGVQVGSASPDGSDKIERFYMKPGFAAAVRSVTTAPTFNSGSIQLISDRGLRYSVPDEKTAKGLGLPNLGLAPESIIKLLPVGASLNTQDVQRTYDVLPVGPNDGSIDPSEAASAGQSGDSGGN